MGFFIIILFTLLWIGSGFWFYSIAYKIKGNNGFNFLFGFLGLILFYITYAGTWGVVSKLENKDLIMYIEKLLESTAVVIVYLIIMMFLQGLLLGAILKICKSKGS